MGINKKQESLSVVVMVEDGVRIVSVGVWGAQQLILGGSWVIFRES